MSIYRKTVYPILSRFDAERTHHMTIRALSLAQNRPLGQRLLASIAGEIPRDSIEVAGLRFQNRIGVAAGFDKDVQVAAGLGLLGFGHIEVGTLTPLQQAGNKKPRVFRLPADHALINRMGFPNCGVDSALPRLRHFSQQVGQYVLGVSIGKQKDTPLEKAVDDYLLLMRQVYPYADYLAINVSSPNTPNLRDLQHGSYLADLLGGLKNEARQLSRRLGVKEKPLFVKIAPDMDDEALDGLLFVLIANEVDGIIATNTTTNRDGLKSRRRKESGGLSGLPLKERSTEIIRTISRYTEGKLPIIGVGGVRTAKDVMEKLDAGASLVQIYTGLIYEGPGMAGDILRKLEEPLL